MVMLKALGGRFKGVSLRACLTYLSGFFVLFFVFLWRLGSLTPGLSLAETGARASAQNWRDIYSSPINAPHKLLQYLFIKLDPGSHTSLRFASAALAVFLVFCFYKLAVSWFGRAIGLFGSLLFITLPLLVVSARQASPVIMFFSPLALLWLYAWLNKKNSRRSLAWISLLIVGALLIYTPGMIWWVIISLAVCRKQLITAISGVPPWQTAGGLLVSAALAAPLVISAVKRPRILEQLALVPGHWAAPLHILKNLGWMILSLFIKTPGPDPLILGRLPILNVLLIALLVFGIYAMRAAASTKTYLLIAGVVFGVLAAAINNNVGLLAFCLPSTMIFVCAGLRYLYIEWRSIFPRNPVPKTFALVLIAAVTASQLYYGLRYSLAAWPHSDATKHSYVLK
jgi:hypothetical protein